MNKRIQKRLVLKRNVKIFMSKLLFSIILFLLGMIFIKRNPRQKELLEVKLYEQSLPFQQVKLFYEKYFGNILSMDKVIHPTEAVFQEKLSYEKMEDYENGVKITVEDHYLVPVLESGVIVYIGEKEKLGSTIIVEQVNGVDTYYSNLTIYNKKLYDYVEKGELLGEAKDNQFYLAFQKKGEYLNYKDYL